MWRRSNVCRRHITCTNRVLGKDWKDTIPGSFLGGHCSIAVCCILILYIVNHLVSWIVKLMMLKDKNTTTKVSLFRACCLNLYLIAKIKPENEQESNTEETKINVVFRRVWNKDRRSICLFIFYILLNTNYLVQWFL